MTRAGDLEEHATLLAERDLAVVEGPRDAGKSEVDDGIGQRGAAVETRTSIGRLHASARARSGLTSVRLGTRL